MKKYLKIIIYTSLLIGIYIFTNYFSWNPFRNIWYPIQIGFPLNYTQRACSEVPEYGCKDFYDGGNLVKNQIFFLVFALLGIVMFLKMGKKKGL